MVPFTTAATCPSFSYGTLKILVFSLAVGFATAQQGPTFNAESNVVLVPTLVRDSSDHVVYGLQAKNFIIEDDGVEQAPHLDEAAERPPISIVIAIQCGRGAKREFSRMRGLASMLDPVLSQSGTEVALIFFDTKVTLARDFTGEAHPYSLKLLNKLPERRQRALLLISETRDNGSHFAKLDDVLTLTGVSNTAVYALPFSPSLSNVLDTERGSNRDEMQAVPDLLPTLSMARQAMRKNIPKAIASMTGGEYELFSSRKGFETRLNSFGNHLHSRYLLSFEPKNPHTGLHQIRVRLSDGARKETVLFRSSYRVVDSNQ